MLMVDMADLVEWMDRTWCFELGSEWSVASSLLDDVSLLKVADGLVHMLCSLSSVLDERLAWVEDSLAMDSDSLVEVEDSLAMDSELLVWVDGKVSASWYLVSQY